MTRALLFLDALTAAPPGELPGWNVVRIEEGRLALTWLKHNPPELILVGERPTDVEAGEFVRRVKLDHAASLLPLIRAGVGPADRVEAEPDAWLAPAEPWRVGEAVAEALAARGERQREAARADVRLSVPSTTADLEEACGLLSGWFAACGFGAQACQHLTLASRELMANAMEWGHAMDASRRVAVHARLDREKASVSVRDTGPGFDPEAVPHAAKPGDPLGHIALRSTLKLREGGFGILMTRGMVDRLGYDATGNEASLTKYLPPRQATAEAGR